MPTTVYDNFRMKEIVVHDAPPSAEMPPVSLGQSVLWYADGRRSSAPRAAKCIQVNDSTIAVVVESPDRYGQLFHGVRHLDDPLFEKDPAAGRHDGGWDYADAPVYHDSLGPLETRVEELEGKLAAMARELGYCDPSSSEPNPEVSDG